MVAFPCKIGAPVTGITLSTRVGRLSETHSDTGFQLTQVTLGRKVREQKGAWVRALERFNIVVTKAAASKPAAQLLGTNRFVGSIMQTTMNQKMENWSDSLWRNEQVHRDDQSLLPLLVHSFIACGRTRRPHAPACVKWKEWW